MVETFFREDRLDDHINETNICLIPKRQHAIHLKDFRPISLCNVGYKIISKILTKKLKPLMPSLISETQSAFVSGRLITDNILIAHEIVHTLKTKKHIAERYVAIKTDMAKAYDRIEWTFLSNVMQRFGFSAKWITMIMECITTVRYRVLINGKPYGDIIPSRGIRQGDPLSPFLFILGTEYLVQILQKCESEKTLTGIKVACSAPMVSHLLFADDSLFFCKSNTAELSTLKSILDHYCAVSGQIINFDKSSLIFGKRNSSTDKSNTRRILNITREGGDGLYLGLPEAFGTSKSKSVAYIKEKLQSRISCWDNKFLSHSGREVLIKAVAMALPTYTMSCFLLPKLICEQLRSLISNFWWKTSGRNSKGIHWKEWKQLSIPKKEGGLGFRDIHSFNLALLGKQGWRLITDSSSLLSRVFKARYFKTTGFLDAPMGNWPSLAWKSIRSSQVLLKEGTRKSIGSGQDTLLWDEPWLPTAPPKPPRLSPYSGQLTSTLPVKVHSLINHYNRSWNRDKLHLLIHEEDIADILKLIPGSISEADGFIWDYSKAGFYSVKSGFWLQSHLLQGQSPSGSPTDLTLNPLFEAIWKSKTSPKIQNFLWQILCNALPVCANLQKKKLTFNDTCSRCGSASETVNHLFFSCPFASLIWTTAGISGFSRLTITESIFDNMAQLFFYKSQSDESNDRKNVYPWILWRIWKSRNSLVFNSIQDTDTQVLERARSEASEWYTSNIDLGINRGASQMSTKITRWEPPSRGYLRCDIDGAWFDTGQRSSIGWILRDWKGEMIYWGSKALSPLQSSLLTEGESMVWAMDCITRLGFNNVQFHTDCSNLVSGLSGASQWPALNTIAQIYFRQLKDFSTSSLKFNPRQYNNAAHAIARHAPATCNRGQTAYIMKLI